MKSSGLTDKFGNPIESEQPKKSEEVAEDLKLPEASLINHIVSLLTAARTYLGIKSHPEQPEPQKHKGLAKYHIDTLEVLKEKCAGNLNPEEEQFFEQSIYELKSLFIRTFSQSEKNNDEKK